MLRIALLFGSMAFQGTPRTQGPAPSPSSAIVARAMAAERKFLDDWAEAWQGSEHSRAVALRQFPPGGATGRCPPLDCNPRIADVICYFNWDAGLTYVPDGAWGLEPMQRKIGSAVNQHHWVCPNWLPPASFPSATPRLPDERLGIDGALEADARRRVAAKRQGLIADLAISVSELPPDPTLIGQLVRLEVDAGALDAALRDARGCRAIRWWCLALTGYVHHRRGEIAQADDAFAQSMRNMVLGGRCTSWSELGPLLDEATRFEYARRPCLQRDSLNQVIWWLADPLWSVPGNDRRTEQFARRVTIALHSATGKDERYNWTPEGGGDALAEMVTRYGWPSYAYTGSGALRVNFGPPKAPVYGYSLLYQPAPKTKPINTPDLEARRLGGLKTTYEYTVGRLHVIPEWSLISNPFGISNSDWSAYAPGGDGDATLTWWPQEHYAPLHPLVEISDQQTAFLRRQDETLYAYATNLGQTDLTRRMGDSVDASLVASTGPDSISVIAERRVDAHDRLTFLAPLPGRPSLVSAEVKWDSAGRRGARARFGVTPAPPLSGMTRGETAISEPVLLVVPPNVTALPADADSAIALMRGSTTLSTGTSAIGVYWETYGFAARDPVEVTLSVQRQSGNLLQRLGVVTGVAADPNALVTVSWKEPQPGHTVHTLDGPVPIQMRSVALNIPTLAAGTYTLTVAVGTRGKSPVTSTREFVLR